MSTITTWMHKAPPNNIGTLRYRLIDEITEIEYQLPIKYGEEKTMPDFMKVFDNQGYYKILDFKADIKWVGVAFEQVIDQHVFIIKLKAIFEKDKIAKEIINNL